MTPRPLPRVREQRRGQQVRPPPVPRALLAFIPNSCCHPANRLTHSRYAKAQRERLDCAGRVGGGGGGGRGGREGSAAAQVEDVGAAARQRSARSTLGRAGRFAWKLTRSAPLAFYGIDGGGSPGGNSGD